MRLVKVEVTKTTKRTIYEIPDHELINFGTPTLIQHKLQSEDSEFIDYLENDMPDDYDPEDVESETRKHEVEWIEDD